VKEIAAAIRTPATPAVSLLFALDRQLEDMMTGGMEARIVRHLALRDLTIEWVRSQSFSMYPVDFYTSYKLSQLL